MNDGQGAWRQDFFASVVPEVSQLASFETPAAAARLWDALNSATADDEATDDERAYAEEERRQRGIQGCEKWVESEKRRASKSILIRDTDGKMRRMKNQSFRGKRKRRDDGTVAHQQAMWVRFTYDDTVALAQGLFSNFYGAGAKYEAFSQVLDAHGKHREALAGEACAREGIDPTRIEISDDDIRSALA